MPTFRAIAARSRSRLPNRCPLSNRDPRGRPAAASAASDSPVIGSTRSAITGTLPFISITSTSTRSSMVSSDTRQIGCIRRFAAAWPTGFTRQAGPTAMPSPRKPANDHQSASERARPKASVVGGMRCAIVSRVRGTEPLLSTNAPHGDGVTRRKMVAHVYADPNTVLIGTRKGNLRPLFAVAGRAGPFAFCLVGPRCGRARNKAPRYHDRGALPDDALPLGDHRPGGGRISASMVAPPSDPEIAAIK